MPVIETEIIQRLPFWTDLTEAEKRLSVTSARLRRYSSGSVLYGCTEGCLGLLYVESGLLRAYISSKEGREITLFRIPAGETCVLSASCVLRQITFDTILKAETDVTALVLPSAVFKKLTDNNIHVRCFSYELATHRFSEAVWVIQQILFNGIDARLAAFLLEQSRATGEDTVVMSQEKIAVFVNSAREVVARMLGRFREEGIVQLKRGKVLIKDRAALEKLC